VSGNCARVLVAGALLLALHAVPLFSTALPPLTDYPNHLARFALLLRGGDAFYEVRWSSLPNLAGDLIVPLLARLMPLEWAGKLFLLMIFVLIVGGASWLNRQVTGGWRLWPLLTVVFLYNRQFLWGFVNYLFGVGLALCGAALWLALERARLWLRLLASALVAALCFFSHIAAFGLYALIILGIEAGPAFVQWRVRHWTALARRAAIAATQFLIPAALVIGAWHAAAGGGISYAGFWRKADLLFTVFDNYSRPFDIACFALLLFLLGGLAWRRRLRLAPRLAPVVAGIGAAYLLLPSQIFTGSGADHRIPLALFLLLVTAAAPRFANRKAALLVMAAVAAVIVGRLAVIEAVWRQADRIYAADIAGLDALPIGSKLAVGYPAAAINATAIPELHLPVLAVARRAAFVPTLFAAAAQQPIALRPPYDRLAAAAPPGLLWAAFADGSGAARAQLAGVLAEYDAIVFVDRQPFQLPPHSCLAPLLVRPTFQLFALQRGCTVP
jgi:hypothetical protein